MHGISAILRNPKLISRFLSEISTWRGLTIVNLSINEELMANEVASNAGLDFDNGL